MAKINPRTYSVISVLLAAALCTASFGKTIYVDDDAAGTNDGSSWANAYVYLQDALADANSADKPMEIRVAQGMYKPDQGLVAVPEFDWEFDWRKITFRLINGVTLKGGYAGFGKPDPDARDMDLYETILSGDLNSDDEEVADPCDLLAEPTRAENSYHVVTGSGTDETAMLDGFTIIDGNADRDEWQGNSSGGGMCNHSGSPTVTNCTFSGNSAVRYGGAVYNYLYSNPTVTKCIFNGNSADYGGGMSNDFSNPTVNNCTFSRNSANERGGGMYNAESSPILTNCTFVVNSAYNGGGMENFVNCSPTVNNCTFSRNSVGEDGGGMHNEYHTNTIVNNCTFSKNSADNDGGGMYNHENSDTTLTECIFMGNSCGNGGGGMWNSMSNPTLFNCIFAANSADFGGGMTTMESSAILINCAFSDNSAKGDGAGMGNSWNSSSILTNCTFSGNRAGWSGGGMFNLDSSVMVTNCTFAGNSADYVGGVYSIWDRNSTLTNCILWDNTFPQVGGDATVSYSDVQGDWLGEGNIDVDPLFADPGYWADVNDPNIVVEPNDPNAVWIDGDYHLKSQAGRWDPVSESLVGDDVTSPCIDAADPNSPVGDEPEPNGGIINMGAYGGTAEASMSPAGAEEIVYIQWLGHSSVKVWTDDCIVYVDPQSLSISPHDATLVCVTHTHGDHYSSSDIARVSNAQTQFIGPPDVISQYGRGLSIAPNQMMEFDFVNIKAVPSYNTNKSNHPKSRNWVGFIIKLGGKRIYVAGDTDLIEEMKSLGDINVAILPAGGTYTMNAVEAAEATQYIKPDLAIPYHWGRNVGTLADAQTFADLARCSVKILAAGETISSDNWPEYSPLIAHWKLDEAEGSIAQDSAGDYNGTLQGNPAWQPTGGKVDGALQFDGVDDYISTAFVLNPADGAFSVFAWMKGGAPGQVIISQADGAGTGETWLGTEPSQGKFMTGLVPPRVGRTPPSALESEFIITDGQWHNIGLAWDGSRRYLYVDDEEVARDTTNLPPLQSSDGGLYFGAGKTLDAATLFLGLIDDIRVYDQALTPAEVAELAR